MKCQYCGSNLEIDNSFCPYCGKENPIAKKHREDMDAYSKEYADTKKEVIDNSRKFNRKNFKIAVIAATVAFVLAAIVFCVFCDNLSYEHYRNECSKRAVQHKDEIKDCVENLDFITLDRIVTEYDLRISPLDEDDVAKYSSAVRVADDYRNLFARVLQIIAHENVKSYDITSMVNSFINMRNLALGEESDAVIKEFYEKAYKDIKYMFKIHLGIGEDTFSRLDEMTQGEIEVMLEEVAYEKDQR